MTSDVLNKMNETRTHYYKTFKERRDKIKKSKFVKYLQKEFTYSSVVGLPYTFNTSIHWFERLFWMVSVFLCIGLAVYFIAFQFVRFMRTPIVMSVEMDYFNWNMSYPAFTLCPTVKYDPDAFTALVNETNRKTGKDLEPYLQTIVSASMENLGVIDLEIPTELLKLIDPKEYAGLAMAVFKKFDNTSMTTNTNWPIAIDEMMTEHGMCHVVNSNVAVFANPNEWHKNLAYQKQNIELSFHDQGFFVQVMDYADIYKVFIHSPDEPILSSTPSYTHSLKGFASFGVTIWSIKISEALNHAPIAFRRCRYINEPVGGRYPVYSYNFCMLECRVRMILKLCGCVPHFYKPLDSERTCSLSELQCVNQYRKEILSLSTSKRTLNKFYDQKDLPRNSHDCGCIGKCDGESFRKEYENFVSQTNMNRLRIGISSFPKVRVVRDIIYNSQDAILKIGGVINLCTGASIITLAELAVIFSRIPLNIICHAIKVYILKVIKKSRKIIHGASEV